jgi:hypothetical protein
MTNIIDAYNATPADLKPGDTMLFTVKAMVTHTGGYKIYRCPWEPFNIDPQGSALTAEQAEGVAAALFPVLTWGDLSAE